MNSLAESNLRLHKIMSNSPLVLAAFPPEDCAEGVRDLDFGDETMPAQHSLGLNWRISTDTFRFHSPDNSKPLTRRGILSTVNSLYDPLGFSVQKSVFPGEYSALMKHVEISQNSPLIKLNPVLGEDGLIRVGGRLTHAPVVSDERYPIVLPGRHHISTLLIRHFHDQLKNQGRLFTKGAHCRILAD